MYDASLIWCLVLVIPALLGAAACAYAALRVPATSRAQPGWLLIGAMPACLAISELLRFWYSRGYAAGVAPEVTQRLLLGWSLLYSLSPLLLCAGIFVLWSAGFDRRVKSASMFEAAMDIFVAGGCIASLLWWLVIELVLDSQFPLNPSVDFPLFAPWLALPLLATSFHFVTLTLLALYVFPMRRSNKTTYLFAAAVGFLILGRYTFLCFALSAPQNGLFAVLEVAACLCLASAALSESRGGARVQVAAPAVAADPETAETRPALSDSDKERITAALTDAEEGDHGVVSPDVASAIETLARIPHESLLHTPLTSAEEMRWVSLRRNMTQILPALVLLGFAWHVAGGPHSGLSGSILGNRLALQLSALEPWWVACLVILALLRHTSRPVSVEQEDKEWVEELQKSTITMGEELHRRTYQLSLLHAVTADLNDSLDCTGVLFTALQRMSEAVRSDGGAIWLRLDFDELSQRDRNNIDGDEAISWRHGSTIPDTLSNTAFVLRELERWEADQRNLAKLQRQAKINIDAQSNIGSMPIGRRWRLAKVQGDDDKTCRASLIKVHGALEGGGLLRGQHACQNLNTNWGWAHTTAIRWKGTVLGAVCIYRKDSSFEDHERTMLDTLGLEAGRALQNAQLFQEATRLADRDSLTDLLNHRAMQQHFNAILAQSRRSHQEFSVLMLDVNNFKFFNDTYGHPVGDRVIRTVARCLRETCRKEDIVGRFGGDEFIVILPDTGTRGALETCSRIAARLEQEAYQEPRGGRQIPIGVSFGAAVYPQDGETALDLLSVADTNLYEAKIGGEKMVIQHDHVEEAAAWRQLRDVDKGGSFGMLDALVTAIDNKDHYTRHHSEDVTQWAVLMARELNFSEEMQRTVRICGLLHDVGKIAVPDVVLRKPGKLKEEEYLILQQHPVFGALLIQNVPHLAEVKDGVRHHHERFDGKGYPDKLAGEHIPLLGRLLAVPDCFSAMTTERPYRKALSWSEAIEEIEKGKGRQFDPAMVDVFMRVIGNVMTGNGHRTAEERALKVALVPPVATRGQVAASSPVNPVEFSSL